MNRKLAAIIKSLPSKPGTYLFQDSQGRFLYIGKAINLRSRVKSHFIKNSDIFKGDLIKNVANIDFIITADEKEALILENELIKKYKPKYNIQWQDDKSYFWVNFSNDEWPRVKISHKSSVISEKNSVSPFVNGRELKQVLRALRKILPYRTCKNPYDKPCLQWHLGLCPAHKSVPSDKLSAINGTKNYLDQLYAYHLSLNTLRSLLRLYAGKALRIEAYDISNIQGTNATGSMIVFKGFKPDKSQYRKFRIKTVAGANDIAMLKEILRRRFNHAEWPFPDIMLIDGGQAQLNAANLAYSQWQIANSGLKKPSPYAISHSPLAIISLAKREEELYTIYSDRVLRLAKLPTDWRILFQAIRNEAHRFAITYYRKLHRKTIKK